MPQNSYTHQLGEFRCTVIADGISTSPPEEIVGFFPAIPETDLRAAFAETADEEGTIPFSMNPLLIQTPQHTILVDTGVGVTTEENAGELYEQLKTVIDPAAIDTVIITHIHGDHVGGLVDKDGAPSFPNARLIMSKTEWEFSQSDGLLERRGEEYVEQLKSRLLLYQNRLILVDGEQEVLPGIRTIPAPGHTPGHTALLIESDGSKLLHLVDAAHHAFQFKHPDWSPRFDFDPKQAADTRRKLMEMAADQRLSVLGYHFEFPGLGTFQRSGDGFIWQSLQAQV